MLLKKLILLSTLLMSATSWGDAVLPAGQTEEARLGMAYDSDTQRFTGDACVRGRTEQHGQAKANISFSQTVSESQLEKELGFEAGAKFRYGAGKMGLSAKYLNSQRSSAYSIVAVYSGDYRFKNILLTFPDPQDPTANPSDIEKERLTGTGLSVRHDDTRWMETCGNEYVQQIERGAKLFYSIRIDFTSETEKDLFEAGFSYDSSYASAHASLKNSKNSFSKNTKVTIGALQIGGDVRRISELFNKEGSGDTADDASLGFVKCSFGDFAKCDQVMATAWHYATQEFKEQLKFDANENTSESGPAYINYITKKYSAAGIYNKYSSVLNKQILQKRKEIEAAFDRELLLSAKMNHYLREGAIVVSKKQRTALETAEKVVKKNIDGLIKAAEICYNTPIQCSEEAEDALNAVVTTPDSVFAIEPEDYRQFCELAKSVISSNSLRESIAGIIAATKELEPNAFTTPASESSAVIPVNECLISEIVLGRNSIIPTFKNKGISTLVPLKEFTHFTVVDFSDNSIDDLTAISGWNRLKEINLHQNKLRDIGPLKMLTSLEKIRVSNNQLRSIDDLISLASLGTLMRIDARNNFPTVNCEQMAKVQSCLSATVKTDSNFVPIQTQTLTPLFMPSITPMGTDNAFVTGMGAIASRFDARENAFYAIQGLSTPSYGAQATTLKNGRVLVSGGWQSPHQLYEYDPQTNMMTSLNPLKVPRADHQVTVLNDGRVLISGGWEQPISWIGTNASYTAEIYDPNTQSTTLLPKMHAPRAWHSATLLENGNVILVGGYSHNGSLATAEIFNTESLQFELLNKSMGEGRGGHTATLLDDGHVLIVAGFNQYNQASATAEIYNSSSGRFEKVHEPLNRSRGNHAALRLQNGKVLITGGSDSIYAPDAPLQGIASTDINASGEIFDPSENSFAEVPTKMYVPRSRHAMLEIKPGLVLIVGGVDYASATNSEVFSYTDTEVSWLLIP